MNCEPVLEVKGVSKKYPGVYALRNVNFEVFPGEVHVLVGENGAGKSTLIRLLKGDEPRDSGFFLYKGDEIDPVRVFAKINSPLSVVYQEFTLLPNLSVAENIFLGCLPRKGKIIDWESAFKKSEEIMRELGCDSIDVRQIAGNLSVAEQQLVEIGKAYSKNPQIFVLDEPTTTFSDQEVKTLFATIKKLTASKKSIIYVTHRLKEVFEIGTRITVLRDGEKVGTYLTSELDEKKLISLMIGKEPIKTTYGNKLNHSDRTPLLEFQNISLEGFFRDISFVLKPGEILGLTGLLGAGHMAISKILYGIDMKYSGKVVYKGKDYLPRSPRQSLDFGVCLIPEDRKNSGIFGEMSVASNICICNNKNSSRFGFFLDKSKIQELSHQYIKKLSIATPFLEQKVKYLSGGNQQKVIISRLLNTNADLFIFEEPTRGIDVGAKEEIHEIIFSLARSGKGILLITSELPDIEKLCNRVLVFYKGQIIKELFQDQMNKQDILFYSTGGKGDILCR